MNWKGVPKLKLKFKATRSRSEYWSQDYHLKDGNVIDVHPTIGQRWLEHFPKNFIDLTPPSPPPKVKIDEHVASMTKFRQEIKIGKETIKELKEKVQTTQTANLNHIKKYTEGIRHIEHFWNIHAGKDIHILGGGPSLDDLPDDFFDDKISIAQSFSFHAFPNCTYYWSARNDLPTWVKKNRPNDFHKLIIGYSSNVAFNKARHWNQLGQWGNDVFCYANCTPCRLVKNLDEVKLVMASILAGKRTEFCDRGTGIHMASQAAITFGPKRIYYHGCEAHSSKTHWHAQKRGLDKWWVEKPKVYSKAWQTGRTAMFTADKQGLVWFAQALKGKIEFIKYWHNKYEKVLG